MQALSRILYAEDQVDIQQVAILALETVGGFTVKTCNSGLEATVAIDDFKPQLLLFDVMMPDMDGIEVCTQLKQNPETEEAISSFQVALLVLSFYVLLVFVKKTL